MSTKKLTILFTPLDEWGHVNCDHGIAGELKARGHRVVFAIDKSFEGVLSKYGFEKHLLKLPVDGNGEEYLIKYVESVAPFMKEEPIVGIDKMFLNIAIKWFSDVKAHDKLYKQIINDVKPDVIITDQFMGLPTISSSRIPWVLLSPPCAALCSE